MNRNRTFLYAAGASFTVFAVYYFFFNRSQARASELSHEPLEFTRELPQIDWQLAYNLAAPECMKGNKKECRKAARAVARGAVPQEGIDLSTYQPNGTAGFYS